MYCKDLFLGVALFFPVMSISCQQPNQPQATLGIVGGGCDGCELMYIGRPGKIGPTDTSAGWREPGQKLLVTGRVYQPDGGTPAPGVIVYYWQTDNSGYYSPGKNQPEGTRRHGHIRGWVKSDADGLYAIYTIRPAPYPNRDIPAHIHLSVKEPSIANEYYTDELVFDDDKLLTSNKRKALENRGGSGVLRTVKKDSLQIGTHNIILGLHIPNYPKRSPLELSGLPIGSDQPTFMQQRISGCDLKGFEQKLIVLLSSTIIAKPRVMHLYFLAYIVQTGL
jgi:protocatechuate 3,4-dioxygenase beta subunit